MLVNIDPAALSSEERYYLKKGLEKLKDPNPTIKELMREISRIGNEEYNEFCRQHGPPEAGRFRSEFLRSNHNISSEDLQ